MKLRKRITAKRKSKRQAKKSSPEKKKLKEMEKEDEGYVTDDSTTAASDDDTLEEELKQGVSAGDFGRFEPNDALRAAWAVHPGNPEKKSLEECVPDKTAPLDQQWAIKTGVATYMSALNPLWDYATLRAKYDAVIILLQYPVAPREAGSFDPEFLNEFCEYMSVLNKGEVHRKLKYVMVKQKGKDRESKRVEGDPILDKNGKQILCRGSWASRAAFNNFKSSVIKVLENLGHKQQSFMFANDNMNDAAVNVGNPFFQQWFSDQFTHLKAMIRK